ncbi:MAG TPA: isoprenylcysteine carboxylmethyltransferase family protein [Methyloceanibacter sp.]|nr:isoprenylcysteine carboxylmethyltransferase family protein [Methyloceanibacter sp.]
MAEETRDTPGVIVFPPLILLAVLVLGLLLDYLVPLNVIDALPRVLRFVVGLLLFLFGASFPIRVRRAFEAAGTNIRPDQPTNAIVTTGLFAHARNPVYLGGLIAILGLALMLGSDWMVILIVPAVLVLHYGVVLREERYLEAKFGAPYLAYKQSVPRYGWKL